MAIHRTANRRPFKPVKFRRTEGPVRAKVGAITYEGYVSDGEFSYVTSKGNSKSARKFTVVAS